MFLDIGEDGVSSASCTLNCAQLVCFEPLPFLSAGDMNIMGREIHRYPLRDYGYLGDWSLPECNHPADQCRLGSSI